MYFVCVCVCVCCDVSLYNPFAGGGRSVAVGVFFVSLATIGRNDVHLSSSADNTHEREREREDCAWQ